jgi:hypothetical protein
MLDNRKVIIDMLGKLADTGSAAIAASAAGTIDGVAKVFDTGGGYTEGKFVIDISAHTGYAAAASCQTIEICLEGSTTTTFTTYAKLASLTIGQKAAAFAHSRLGNDSTIASIGTGRFIKPFTNDFGGTVLRYLRCYAAFGGTVSDNDIEFEAWLSK